MELTRQDVERISLLARLKLSEGELATMTEQLGQIVHYVEQLAELDTEEIEPMAHAWDATNIFREDELRPSLERADALTNAPDNDGEFYRAPAVLG